MRGRAPRSGSVFGGLGRGVGAKAPANFLPGSANADRRSFPAILPLLDATFRFCSVTVLEDFFLSSASVSNFNGSETIPMA